MLQLYGTCTYFNLDYIVRHDLNLSQYSSSYYSYIASYLILIICNIISRQKGLNTLSFETYQKRIRKTHITDTGQLRCIFLDYIDVISVLYTPIPHPWLRSHSFTPITPVWLPLSREILKQYKQLRCTTCNIGIMKIKFPVPSEALPLQGTTSSFRPISETPVCIM